MFNRLKENKISFRPEDTKGLFGETDRANGEYHFSNGDVEEVYSNAHYVPVDETTAPPRYYRPAPQKTHSEAKKSKKTGYGFFAFLLLCLSCAVIGGLIGAYAIFAYSGFAPVSASVKNANDALQSVEESFDGSARLAAMDSAFADSDPLSAQQIYEIACGEVVSINTEIVTVNRYGEQIPSKISGSGFAISSDGYILTNYHAVQTAAENNYTVDVVLFDGSIYEGRVAGIDADSDIAVVKIDYSGLKPASIGDSSSIKVGDCIYAVGNPYGVLDFSFSPGCVSGPVRSIATDENEQTVKMFQIDADVFEGNSGGPVYNDRGEVVGIVTAKYSSGNMAGIGFAIPINEASGLINDITDKGYITGKPSLGIYFDERYNSMYSRYWNLPMGAFVYSVDSGSCSEQAGIVHGDIIIGIGDYQISEYSDIKSALKHFNAGDSADISIYRNGELYKASLVFDEEKPRTPSAEPVIVPAAYVSRD